MEREPVVEDMGESEFLQLNLEGYVRRGGRPRSWRSELELMVLVSLMGVSFFPPSFFSFPSPSTGFCFDEYLLRSQTSTVRPVGPGTRIPGLSPCLVHIGTVRPIRWTCFGEAGPPQEGGSGFEREGKKR